MSLWVPGHGYTTYAMPTQDLLGEISPTYKNNQVAVWPIWEDGGVTVYDISPNDAHGTISSEANVLWDGWDNGPCLNFNGSNPSYVDMGDLSYLSQAQNFSAMCWFSYDSTEANTIGTLMGKTTGTNGWRLRYGSSTSLVLYADYSTTDINGTVSCPDLRDGQMHFICVTVATRAATIYLDGIPRPVTSGTLTGVGSNQPAASSTFKLGVSGTTTNPHIGKIAFASFCGAALQPEEVMEMYLQVSHVIHKTTSFYGWLHTYNPAGLDDTLTPSETIVRVNDKGLSDDAIIASDALQSNPTKRLTGDSYAIIGDGFVIKNVFRELLDAPSLVETAIRTISRNLSESSTLSEALQRGLQSYLSEIADALSDSLQSNPTKVASDGVTTGDSLLSNLTRTFSEILSLGESFESPLSKQLLDVLTAAETILRNPTKLVSDVGYTLTDVLAKMPILAFLDSISSSDGLLRTVSRNLSDSGTLSEALVRAGSTILSDTLSASETLVRTFGKVFSDTLTYAGDTLIRGPVRQLSSTISAAETFSRAITRRVSSALTGSETLTKQPIKQFVDALTAGDENILLGYVKQITSSLEMSESMVRALMSTMSEGITLAEDFFSRATIFLSDALSAADDILRIFVRNLFDSANLSEHDWAKNFFRGLSDGLEVSDRIRRVMQAIVADALEMITGAGVEVNPAQQMPLSDILTLVDALRAFIIRGDCSRTAPLTRVYQFDRIYSAIHADVVNQYQETFTAYQVQSRPDGTTIYVQYEVSGVLQVSQGRRIARANATAQTQRGAFWTTCSTLTQGTMFVANDIEQPRILKRRMVVPLEGDVTEFTIPESYPQRGTLRVGDTTYQVHAGQGTGPMGESHKLVLNETLHYDTLEYGILEYTCYQVITVLTDGVQVQRPVRGFNLGVVYRHDVSLKG